MTPFHGPRAKVEPQPPLLFLGAVAGQAMFGEDRSDVAGEVDRSDRRLRGKRRWWSQKQREGQRRQPSDRPADPSARFRTFTVHEALGEWTGGKQRAESGLAPGQCRDRPHFD